MKVLNFTFKPSSRLSPSQATTVGKFLIELQERSGSDELKPKDVLEAARDVASPIHEYFTWDDGKAAEKQRLSEAAYLLRSIQIEYVDLGPDRRAGTMRMLVNLKRDPLDDGEHRVPSDRVYLPMVSVLEDPARRHQLLMDALDQALQFQARYEHIKELAEIFEAIKHVQARLTKSRKDEPRK